MTQRTAIGAAMALALTASGFASAEEDATPGSSVRPPANAAGSASTVIETAVPAEDRETSAGPGLPGDTLDHVEARSAPQASAPNDDAAEEEKAAMKRADENEEAVRRYIETLSD